MASEKPESHPFNLESIRAEFDAVLETALAKVSEGKATARYEFRDNIRDGEHLKHITITEADGTILYDEDFILEDAYLRQIDRQDN
jgi:hypothetical protein